MDLYGRSQPKEEGFRYCGDLERTVHVDYGMKVRFFQCPHVSEIPHSESL